MHKAIPFCAMLFVIPLMLQEADAVIGQEIRNFTSNWDGYMIDRDDSHTCSASLGAGNLFDTIGSFFFQMGTRDLDLTSDDCTRSWIQWDLSSIPDDTTILDVKLFVKRTDTINGLATCTIRHMDFEPIMKRAIDDQSDLDLWNDMQDGTPYVVNSNWCIQLDTPVIDLGGAANTDVKTALTKNSTGGHGDWFAIGIHAGSETVSNQEEYGRLLSKFCIVPTQCEEFEKPRLQVTYTNNIDPVDILFVTKFELTGVDLGWVEPNTNGEIITGYQINFTTPHGEPLAPITNNTNSTTTVATITNLISNTNYTFRLTAVTEGLNKNIEGKLLNITTISLGNFTIGFATLEADNFDARDIKYTRRDEPNDVTKLEVVYPVAFNLTCTFDYRFQNTNQTFANLVTVPESTDGGGIPALAEQKATFTFINASKEVIRVLCTDVNTNASAPFLLTVSQFPIINQLMAFRAGDFGTDGMLGAVDIITLGVVVMVMIGFNRWNESVGAIFAVGLLGGLSFFQIVEWQTFMFGTFAVVIMVVVASTRKN